MMRTSAVGGLESLDEHHTFRLSNMNDSCESMLTIDAVQIKRSVGAGGVSAAPCNGFPPPFKLVPTLSHRATAALCS